MPSSEEDNRVGTPFGLNDQITPSPTPSASPVDHLGDDESLSPTEVVEEDETDYPADEEDEELMDNQWLIKSLDDDTYTDDDSLLEFYLGATGERSDNSIRLPGTRLENNKKVKKRRIYGRDDRECCDHGDYLPYSAVGYIPSTRCTGFLVAPNIVMTAAHCLFDTKSRSFWNVTFDFFRGRTNEFEGEQMTAAYVVIFRPYIIRSLSQNDYGFIILKNDSDEYLGFMFKNFTDQLPIRILSYSYDKDKCVCSTTCNATLHSLYGLNELNEDMFCYYCDVVSESSGSPILYNRPLNVNGQIIGPGLIAVGVHNAGNYQYYGGGVCNVGARITHERFCAIQKLKNKHANSKKSEDEEYWYPC